MEADPSPIRKNPDFITSSIDTALQIMCSIEYDHAEWNEDEGDGEQQEFHTACESLNRMSEALGPKSTFVACKKRLDHLLSQDSWKLKYAGLNAMMQVMDMLKKEKVPTAWPLV
eukprot:TRINITY_DN2272_c0_g1_i1.p2 TRINITY_DN2272_c0_g1~~TRINITY_DN2272_c0_g1_i1.p2  ORF type:complete len:114 (+),score=37.69 TRINITY_DN2272_c0_g1_i1:305-646(+)